MLGVMDGCAISKEEVKMMSRTDYCNQREERRAIIEF
jgi:hypothetical protein